MLARTGEYKDQKVGFFDNLYVTSIHHIKVLYNPYSYKGQLLLNTEIYSALKKILIGRHTYYECQILLAKKLSNLDKKSSSQILENLVAYDLLSFDNKKNYLHFNPSVSGKMLIFWIDITNQCNFRCTYCFVDKKKEVLNIDKFEKFLDRLSELRKKYQYTKLNFILSGGEPLLYFDTLKKVVTLINRFEKKQKNLSVDKNVITNGTLLTHTNVAFLKENKIHVNISLDGIGKYNDLTRKFTKGNMSTFPYIMKGIKLAKSEGVLGVIATTVTSKNIEHLSKFSRFLVKEGIKFQFQFYKESSQFCRENPLALTDKSIEYYLRAIKTVYSMYKIQDIQKKVTSFIDLDHSNTPTTVTKQGCSAGNIEYTVTTNCEIKVCPASEVAIPFEKAFDFIAAIREKNSEFVNFSIDSNPVCKKCLWKYQCKGRCKLEMMRSGKLNEIPQRCTFYKKLYPLIIKLEAERIVSTNVLALAKK
ncbi:MAG: radical SAM protein [Candidatus Roizmanbacteria bacterium]|nr:radical SAM protein [Candidatus Roizmanbacteria bacterium]